MSNLPLGAEYNDAAPYNIKEETFKFTFVVDVPAWYEYYGLQDPEEAYVAIDERLKECLKQLGDIEISKTDLSIY